MNNRKPLEVPVFENLDKLDENELIYYEKVWCKEKQRSEPLDAFEKYNEIIDEMRRRGIDIMEYAYSWNDVETAANNLYAEYFDQEVNDYVSTCCGGGLPVAIVNILAYIGAYNPSGTTVDEDITLLRQAYKQLVKEGKIGY